MPCIKYLSGSEKRKKKFKQVRDSCRKLSPSNESRPMYVGGGGITQLLPRALSFLVTPLILRVQIIET
jgi:hypothetical protein